jgi:demethylmenaquinone methyltransferase/2-methoxy-6-polyprenyl-1,4-benzoquinol methylase
MPPEATATDARERTRRIQSMFGRIVPRYDRLNRLLSFGMDAGWRRAAVRAARPSGLSVLDLGTGTGNLAREVAAAGAALVVGADLTPGMLAVASARHDGDPHRWALADAQRLPFRDSAFDAVTNAFLLRNLPDLDAALREMARVLRPGGRLVCLDMTPPPRTPFAALYRLYFNRIAPPIAGWLSGDRAAYRYLPGSLEGFPNADALASVLRDAGFADVWYKRMAGGAVALHAARKPPLGHRT